MFTGLTGALLIFSLRVVDVSLGTFRSLLIMRGMRKWAPAIGFFEVTIWIVAVSGVIAHVHNFGNIIAYSGGFAAGTLLGMWMEDKVALGFVRVHVLSVGDGKETVRRVREAGFGATQIQGQGHSGPVSWTTIVTPRSQAGRLIKLVDEIDSTSFVTIDDTRQVYRGYIGQRK